MIDDDIKIERIKKILADYRLELILPVANLAHKERFFVHKIKDENGKMYTIKYLRQIETAEKDVLLKFNNEVLFLEYIGKQSIFSKQMTQKVLAHDFSEGWRIAEYLDGERISKTNDFYPYNPDLLKKISPEVIVNFFYQLQQIDLEDIKKEIPTLPIYGLEKHLEYYRKMEPAGYILDNLKNNRYGFLSGEESALLLKIYQNPGELYFSKQGMAHSDLNPENILVNGQDFYVLDWENVGIGQRMNDFVSFWARSYLNPVFQKELFEKMQAKFIDKEEFSGEFYRSYLLSFLGIYEFQCLNRSLKRIGTKEFERAIKFIKDTYLVARQFSS